MLHPNGEIEVDEPIAEPAAQLCGCARTSGACKTLYPDRDAPVRPSVCRTPHATPVLDARRSLGEGHCYGPDMRKDRLCIVTLKSFRSSKAVDVPAQPRVGERTKNQIPVIADVGRVSGHERDATARFDNCGSHGELVDPVQYARLTPTDS